MSPQASRGDIYDQNDEEKVMLMMNMKKKKPWRIFMIKMIRKGKTLMVEVYIWICDFGLLEIKQRVSRSFGA